MVSQILWGSLLLGICSLLHLLFISWWVEKLSDQSVKLAHKNPLSRHFFPIAGTFALLVFSHTVQVWLWATALTLLGALPDMFQATYFSLVTYTTLGYGDVVLSNPFKLFGSMASVTGLLNFGVSTAVLVAVLSNTLSNETGRK